MSEKSEKSVIIPAIFDDCEAIQVVNGVPALVIKDKDGTQGFFNVDADEFIRRTGVSRRILENLDTLLGMPIYWMADPATGDPEDDYNYRLQYPATLFNSYQAYSRSIIARGAHFGTGSQFGARPFTILLSYSKPDEYAPNGLVTLAQIDD